jgi:hypothetical protein
LSVSEQAGLADELGRLLKLRKERESMIPKLNVKKRKIRKRRNARRVLLKKWMINISD